MEFLPTVIEPTKKSDGYPDFPKKIPAIQHETIKEFFCFESYKKIMFSDYNNHFSA